MAKKTTKKAVPALTKEQSSVEALPMTVGGTLPASETVIEVIENQPVARKGTSQKAGPVATSAVLTEAGKHTELALADSITETQPPTKAEPTQQEEILPPSLPSIEAPTEPASADPLIAGPDTREAILQEQNEIVSSDIRPASVDLLISEELTSPEAILQEPTEPASADILSMEEPAQPAESNPQSGRGELVKSATLVMLGNLGSSVLGMFRQTFISSTGPSIAGPFMASLSPAQKFNDFLVNGSVQGVLIPTFNDYAAPEKRHELRRLVFTIVNLVALIMLAASIGFLLLAPWFSSHVLATKYSPDEQLLTIHYARIVFFSLIALGPFAVLQGALYAQKEFGWTAFAASAYHGGIIIGAIFTGIVGKNFFGEYGIALGVILGAFGEIALLIPGMRRQHLSYMFVLDLTHPALRKIMKLYAPIAFSFFVASIFAFLDQFFATQTPCAAVMQGSKECGAVNFSSMGYATFLIQFPGGLVASALAFAVLPTLTQQIRENNTEGFKNTLLMGFRLGLLLMVPAAAGLIVLQLPIVKLLFEHGKALPVQSLITATALQNFAYQLPFVALDQLLIAAFYARKNTIIPVAVGVVSYFCYLLVALPTWSTIGMPALAFANTVQNSLHAIILLFILRRVVGSLHIRNMLPAILKILVAATAMVVVAWAMQLGLAQIGLFSLNKFIGQLLTVVVVGAVAAGVYFGMVMLLKVEEVSLLKGAVLAKLGKK